MTKSLVFLGLLVVLALGACTGGTAPAGLPTTTAPQTAPIAAATLSATAVPTTAPTVEPTAVPITAPTATVTTGPTATVTAEPTATPTRQSTATSTPAPTAIPSPEPTATPTLEPTPAPAACDNPYLPVAAGRQWVYQMSGVASDRFTRTIVSVSGDGFADRDQFSSGTVREGAWRCQSGNLIALTPGTAPAVSAAGMRFEFTVESNEGVTLPADLRPGRTWSQRLVYSGRQTVGELTIESRNDLTTSCKAIGEEQVTVPAGTFQALRVECTYAMKITLQGTTLPLNTSGVNWYVRGMGVVKSVDQSDAGATQIVLVEAK